MMTAMARLPCKPTSITHQQQQQQQMRHGNFDNGIRNYWDMQTRQQQSTTPIYVRSQHRQTVDHTGKRRSAVELLQESKAFYVKSEVVLDRKQELKNSGHLQVAPSTAPGAPPRLLRKCGNAVNCNAQQQQQQQQGVSQLALSNPSGACCWANCQQDRPDGVLSPQRTLPPPLPPKSPRLISVPQRRAIPGLTNTATNGSDQLQTKLRRLLNTDSKENVFYSDNSSGLRTTINNNLRDGELRYSPASPLIRCRDDTDCPSIRDMNTDVKFKFGRSNSHSHTTGKHTQKSNISPATETTICHKSLPDLHTSVSRRRSSLSPRASCKSSTRALPPPLHHYSTTNNCPDCETSSDYSAHSFKRDAIPYHSTRIRRSLGSAGGGDASSVLSSGGRTQKSSGSSKLSHGATARDSGGSSGHCTHRSEPPPSKIQDCWNGSNSGGGHVIRRDSGASTQHSNDKEQSRPRKVNYFSGNSSSMAVRNLSPNSDSTNSQTDYSPTCNSRFSDVWKAGRDSRPILRSKSDISDRYWRHCDNGRKKIVSARVSTRSVTELENFFNQLGLDSDNYHALTALPTSKSSSPIFFDSVSSVDSALGLHSWSANNQQQSNNCNGGQQQWQSGGGNNYSGNDDTSQRVSDPPSIVERNARIIKWLCQCRKVQFGYS